MRPLRRLGDQEVTKISGVDEAPVVLDLGSVTVTSEQGVDDPDVKAAAEEACYGLI